MATESHKNQHPIYSIVAHELRVGDLVLYRDGNRYRIASIGKRYFDGLTEVQPIKDEKTVITCQFAAETGKTLFFRASDIVDVIRHSD